MPDLFLPKGVLTPLVTPFRNDDLDETQLSSMIERQISAGIGGIIVCDQMGEGLSLTADERRKVTETALTAAAERIPVIAAVGTNCTAATIDAISDLPEGVAALLVTVPYYSKPTAKGIAHHFQQVSEATDLPIIIDDDPKRTAKPLTYEILEALQPLDTIRGIRHCSEDVTSFVKMPPGLKRRYRHYAGDDRTAPAYLTAGASCLSSPIANIFPELVRSFYDLALIQHGLGEVTMHSRICLAIAALGPVEPPSLKHALSLLCDCREDVRLPLLPLDNDKSLPVAELMARHLLWARRRA